MAPFYLEAAISNRMLSFFEKVRGARHGIPSELQSPSKFVEFFIASDRWKVLFDEAHFFEFVDFNDKKVILNFLWIIISLHQVRSWIMRDTSVAVVGAKKAGKGATLNALFHVGAKSGFSQSYTTKTVESFR